MRKAGFTIGVAISILVIIYLCRTVSARDVIELILQADKGWALTFLICSFAMSFGHTWRYLTLLSVSGYRVNPLAMYLVVLVRNLASDLLPARIGTVVYVYLITSRLGIPLAAASSSFGYALVFDLLAVAPLILVASLLAFSATTSINSFSLAILGTFCFFFFALLALAIPYISRSAVKILRKIFSRFETNGRHPALSLQLQKVLSLAVAVETEVQRTADAHILGRLISLSLMIRLSKYLGLYAILMALLVPRGYTFAEVPPAKALLGMFAAEISASLPISGIGGIGTYQGAWLTAFHFLGFPEQLAAITSVSHHLFSQVYGYSLGVIAFMLLLLMIRPRVAPTVQRTPMRLRTAAFAAYQLAFVVAVGGAIFCIHGTARAGPLELMPSTLSSEDRAARKEFFKHHSIVFDSNRSGTFGIYRVVAGSDEPVAVVDAPDRHEMYPALSPDRKWLVYASAKGPGRYAESEIHLFSFDSGKKSLLAENATFPSFTADGKAVVFERNRSAIMKISLPDRFVTELFPAAHKFGRFEVVKPRVSPSGTRVAFTSDRPSRWFAYVADTISGELTKITHGCQPTFINDQKVLFVKNKGAEHGAGLYFYDSSSRSEQEAYDPKVSGGKEYFPSMRENILLFSSGEGGSHESGPFTIYARVNDATIRLTADFATNRWPLLF